MKEGEICRLPVRAPLETVPKRLCQLPLLNELQVQGDAHTVDEDYALIEELLVGDFGVDELLEGGTRANEFDRFGGALGAGGEFVQNGKVEELEFHVGRNPVGQVFKLRGEEEVKALGRTLVDGAFLRTEQDGIAEGHLEGDPIAEDHEGGQGVIDEMIFRCAFFGEGG